MVEAIYNGAPIVTTSVGSEGIPDVEKVLLVKDQPDEFAETVVELYKDEKLPGRPGRENAGLYPRAFQY